MGMKKMKMRCLYQCFLNSFYLKSKKRGGGGTLSFLENKTGRGSYIQSSSPAKAGRGPIVQSSYPTKNGRVSIVQIEEKTLITEKILEIST